MRLSYKQKLFVSVALLFVFFAIGIVLFERARGQGARAEALERQLQTYTQMIGGALLRSDSVDVDAIDRLVRLFPSGIRVSLIDSGGCVLYDNVLNSISSVENHLMRPEIQGALKHGKGTDIRISTSNSHKYLYYAQASPPYYIRAALPYNVQTERLMQGDYTFLYFTLLLFVMMLIGVNLVAGRFSNSIRQLRDFSLHRHEAQLPQLAFPDDELGEIGSQITESYRQLRDKTHTLDLERKRLLQHVYSSREGICFFTPSGEVYAFNGLFLRYLNTLLDTPTSDPAEILSADALSELRQSLMQDTSYAETKIEGQGKVFAARVNRFEDLSFEIILNDISTQEQTRRLKQEMTANIAHELRTPVTSVRGYLETVLEQSDLEPKQRDYFLQRAYRQIIVLSELIQDISLVTKMDEAPHLFHREAVDLGRLLDQLQTDLSTTIAQRSAHLCLHLPESVIVQGNKNLLYSVFRNLTDNALNYAGSGITIDIEVYDQDEGYYYFSFSDNGVGVSDPLHLPRLFDRFYRVAEGRSRDSGGSGLGLAIVKNAIALHGGHITAKMRSGGGLTFLFEIHK